MNEQTHETKEEVKEQKDPRRVVREMSNAEAIFKHLMDTYIAFKNNNFAEMDGRIILHDDVCSRFKELDARWRKFCHNTKMNHKKRFQYDFWAFANAVEKHNFKHRHICWTNHVMKILKERFKQDADVRIIAPMFQENEPQEISMKRFPLYQPKVEAYQAAVDYIKEQNFRFKVEFKTNMHTVEIPDINVLMMFPSELDEFNTQQFIAFCRHTLELQAGSISGQQFKERLLADLAGIKVTSRYLRMTDDQKKQVDTNYFLLSECLESLFEDKEIDGKPVKELKVFSVKNFIPKIGRRYYGPKDAMEDATFCEYRMAYQYFRSYLTTKNEDDLSHMIAVLYRPRPFMYRLLSLLPWYDGRRRVRFTAKSNPYHFEKRAARFAKLPAEVRFGIFLFFAGCERFFKEGKPVIGLNEIDLSILYEPMGDKPKTPDIGLVGVLYELAESKVFGSIEETDNVNIYDVLIRLYQVVRQAREAEEKIRSKK